MSHLLNLGDCLDPVTGLASLPDRSVDHVICDPPYSEHVHGKQWRGSSLPDTSGDHAGESRGGRACFARATSIGFEAITQDQILALSAEWARVARRWVMAFCDAESVSRWIDGLTSAGLDHVRVGAWIKLGSTPQFTGDRPASGFEAIVIAHQPGRKRWNRGGGHGVWTVPIVLERGDRDERRVHTTQKPLALMESLVRDFTDTGETILDPFAGSGTTGVAAKRLGRGFVGWERDERYHAIATKRIAGTAEQAQLFGERVAKVKQAGFEFEADHG